MISPLVIASSIRKSEVIGKLSIRKRKKKKKYIEKITIAVTDLTITDQ